MNECLFRLYLYPIQWFLPRFVVWWFLASFRPICPSVSRCQLLLLLVACGSIQNATYIVFECNVFLKIGINLWKIIRSKNANLFVRTTKKFGDWDALFDQFLHVDLELIIEEHETKQSLSLSDHKNCKNQANFPLSAYP